MKACSACAGCGKVANDEDHTPWKYWAEMPLQSSVAVLMGLVKPETCLNCGGSGTASIMQLADELAQAVRYARSQGYSFEGREALENAEREYHEQRIHELSRD